MMRKRGLCLLLLVVLILNAAGKVSGQEDTVVVQLVMDVREKEDFANNILQQLEDILASEDVQLQLIKYSPDNIGTYSLDIQISQWDREWGTSLVFNVYLAKPENLTLSPFLYSQAGFGSYASVTEQHGPELLVNVLAAMSLYSIDRCGAADKYIQTAHLEYEKIYTSDAIISAKPAWGYIIGFIEGNCALLDGRYTDAITIFEDHEARTQALLGPEREMFMNYLWVLIQAGRHQEAFQHLESYLQVYGLKGAWGDAVFELKDRAQLYALVERYDNAIADFTTALELDSENPELYTLRGQMYLALYEWDSALADYNAALELAPDYADAYFYRGLLYYSILQTGTDLRDDALADFRRYLELAPTGDHAADAAHSITTIQAELNQPDKNGITPLDVLHEKFEGQ